MTALGGERAALVEAVMPFLDQWQGLLKDMRQLTPERVTSLLDRAESLRHQADRAGQGGVVHHLDVCIECLKAPALDRRGFQEALRNLSEVTWQLKQDAGPRRGAESGPPSMLQPPLLSGQGAALPSNVSAPPGLSVPPGLVSISSRSGFEPPPPISLPGGGGQRPPPNLERSLRPGQVERAPAVIERSRGGAAPVVAPVPPPPPPQPAPPAFTPAGPSILKKAAQRSAPPPEPPQQRPQQEPPVAAPRILGGRAGSEAPQARPKEKPNLMVATMFGLRAFGRGRGGGGAEPPPQQRGSRPSPGAPPPQVLGQKGVLGLGKRDRKDPSPMNGAPGWIGPREGGLPELASGGPPSLLDTGGSDLDDRLRKLREGEDSRGDRRSPTRPPRGSSADRSRSGSSRSSRDLLARDYDSRRRESGFPVPWWIGVVAVAVVGIVVVVVLVLGHRPGAAQPDEPNVVAAGEGPAMPTSKLLDDKERMRVLMSLVHSYGGEESPELADLVNEEAALVYEVLEQNCDQPGDKCQRPVPMVAGTVRSGATPQNEIHHLFEDRKLSSTKKNQGQGPKWLAGLTMPAIGAGDDPYLHKLLDYYTVNQSGREEFKNMLFRCGAYLDLIERTLVHYGMPRVLLALVMTESQCVPNAESPVGALGLWQFMPATARAYHLHVKEGIVDERISPPKSTDAAVKFIADLYRKMNNWEFALASYNMGAFGLSARIRRAGGDVTFWDLAAAGYLPEETSKYVPRIQAYAVILENLAHFNFSTLQMRTTESTAEIEAPAGTRLSLLARAASTSVDHLRLLNPDIVGTVVPDVGASTNFMVQLPKEGFPRARTMLDELIAAGDQNDRCVPSGFDWGAEPFDDSMCAGSEAPPKKKKKKY